MTHQNQQFISVENVIYQHWNQETPTLKGVSFTIQENTINVLVGPGGSGKSTLCSLFNGEIPHLLGGKMEGDVLIDGINTREMVVKNLSQLVGHVLQDPESMFATLYVEDEIAFGPENLNLDISEISDRVEKLLHDIELWPQRQNLVWQLSGGQVQKLGLAVILAMKPRMIVLDEPTANLDPAATRSVHELILKLRDEGMTVFLVTRELDDFILSAADQLLVINEGQMIASGSVQDVMHQHGGRIQRELGIWLPESVEIGIALNEYLPDHLTTIPITVDETLSALKSSGVLSNCIMSDTEIEIRQVDALGAAPLITARTLSYTYKNGFKALKDVSFDIYPGEMLAIVGRNGAGKSTLAKLLVGLLKPQEGELTLFSKPAKEWKPETLADHIALVFQNPEHQFLTDTVFDEIAYSLLSRGITDKEEISRQVNQWLERLELNDNTGKHPFALSAGKKRRLGVATMLVCHPKILLVDEPTYGQDKEMTRTLMELMENVRAQGVSVVMITHDMRLVQEYAHRVLVMADGKILYEGDPVHLFQSADILQATNLRPTLLQEILKTYQDEGGKVDCAIHNTSDLMEILTSQSGREATHVSQ